jgi:hypothetical protein
MSTDDDLPAIALFAGLQNLRRAGSATEQAALQQRARTILEPYTTPADRPGVRVANEWLGSRRWRVQLVHHLELRQPTEPHVLFALEAALQAPAMPRVLGANVDPQDTAPTAVFAIPPTETGMGCFFGTHFIGFHMLFAEDLSFAIVANEGDFAAIAGPEAFVRNALPTEFIGREATEKLKKQLEFELDPGWFDGILAHYAPFMLHA